MTQTLHFKDVLVGHTSLTRKPIHVVTYEEPSPSDREWSLSEETNNPLLYFFTWSLDPIYLPDRDNPTHPSHATHSPRFMDYPIYNKVAQQHNWSPA